MQRNIRVNQLSEFQPFVVGSRGQHGEHIFNNIAQIKGRVFDDEFTRVNFRQIKNVVNNRQQIRGRFFNGVQIIMLLAVYLCSGQQVTETDNTVKRGADFVRHIGQEFRFHLTGFQSLLTPNGQLAVAHFQFVEGFLQVAGGLFNTLQIFPAGALQRTGHGVHTSGQLFEFRGPGDMHPGVQFAVLEVFYCAHDAMHGFGNLSAGTDGDDGADQQGSENNRG